MARAVRLLPDGSRPTSPEERAALHRRVVDSAPARPGVYLMRGEKGGVIYVGKSTSLRDRLLGYFREKRGQKGAKILREARSIEWSPEPNELAALLEELRLIKRHRPRFNVSQKRDAEHYVFLRVTPGPAPGLEVLRGGAADDGACYGPFIGPGLVAEAARELADALGLRDCPDRVKMVFRQPVISASSGGSPSASAPPGHLPVVPDCHRHDVGKCLGPCVAACTASEYDDRVTLARAFLGGESDALLREMRREMERSSVVFAYERAALYRDRLTRLARLHAQLDKVRIAVERLSFVYPVDGHEGDDRVYLIRRGTVRAVAPKPVSTADRIALQALIDRVFGPGEPLRGPVRTHEIEEILLLTSWFRRRPAELAKTWAP